MIFSEELNHFRWMPALECYSECLFVVSNYKLGSELRNRNRRCKRPFYHEKIAAPAGHEWIAAIRSATVFRPFAMTLLLTSASGLHRALII